MTVTETLLELEDRMWRANREGDGAVYQEMLREDALAVSRYGVMGKDQLVPMVHANRNPYLKTELSDRKVIELDENCALVTYRADVTALVDGNEVELPSYATSVYVRTDGEWRAAFFQQTSL